MGGLVGISLILHEFAIDFRVLFPEATEDDITFIFPIPYVAFDGIPGYFCGSSVRITVHAGADAREGDAFQVVGLGHLQGGGVAGCQQLGLVVPSAVPYGADGMDDFLAGQLVRSGHLALAGPASAQRAAFLQQFFARSAVYGSVHAPASQQGTVRSVYYGIHLQLRDVSHDYFYPVFHVSLRMVCCYAPKIAKGMRRGKRKTKFSWLDYAVPHPIFVKTKIVKISGKGSMFLGKIAKYLRLMLY